jgi:hypothetical protein
MGALELKAAYIRQKEETRKTAGLPSGYEEQDANALESAIREIREWRQYYRHNFGEGGLGD